MMAWLTDAATAYRLIEVLAAVTVVISSLEILWRPQYYRDDSLMSWPVCRLFQRWTAGGVIGSGLDFLLRQARFKWFVAARLAAAVVLMAHPLPAPWRPCVLIWLALSGSALAIRSPWGQDGADQMSMLTFGVLALVSLSPDAVVMEAGLWFIGLQTCLSYFVAGISKLVSADWRSGRALVGIAQTRMYGNPEAAAWLARHPRLVVVIARSVIAVESLFPLVLLGGSFWMAVAMIAIGLLFHLASAVLMGLNTFLWSFVATYPALVYCACWGGRRFLS